jgi:hypothetical protein
MDFIDAVSLCSKAILDSIITMNKIMVSLPHICDKEADPLVAGEGEAWTHQGKNPPQPDKKIVPCIL